MVDLTTLNRTAETLKNAKDLKGLKRLCRENGVDEADAEDYMDGCFPELFTPFTMAMAKITEERKKLDLPSEMSYYTDSIIEMAKDPVLATAICSPNKNLAGALGAILKVASKNRKEMPMEIIKAAGWQNGKIYTGNIDRPEFKAVVTRYYTEDKA